MYTLKSPHHNNTSSSPSPDIMMNKYVSAVKS